MTISTFICRKRFHNIRNPTITQPYYHKRGSQSCLKYIQCPLHTDPYPKLSPTERTESGRPVAICFPLPHSSSCAELLLPVSTHFKELEASVLTCCNAEQLLPLLHINFRSSAYNRSHIPESLETFVLQAGLMAQWCVRPLTWVPCMCTHHE